MPRSSSAAGCTERVRLAQPAVGVARIDAFDGFDPASACLQPRDRARLVSIASGKRRRELLAGRRLLQALANHLDMQATFDGAEDGGGVVACAGPRVAASVTHAGPWVACAIADTERVGIDLEVLADRDFMALAEAAFPDAVAALSSLPAAERGIAFYHRWTLHEAAIKCGPSQPRRQASWMLRDAWVLSLQWVGGAASVDGPLLWDAQTARFVPSELQVLAATANDREE